MDLLNEDLEGESKEKIIMSDTSTSEKKCGLLLIDINYEEMQVHKHILVLFFVINL